MSSKNEDEALYFRFPYERAEDALNLAMLIGKPGSGEARFVLPFVCGIWVGPGTPPKYAFDDLDDSDPRVGRFGHADQLVRGFHVFDGVICYETFAYDVGDGIDGIDGFAGAPRAVEFEYAVKYLQQLKEKNHDQ